MRRHMSLPITFHVYGLDAVAVAALLSPGKHAEVARAAGRHEAAVLVARR